MEEPIVSTITTLMTEVGKVFTSAIGWAGTVGTTITGSPLLLMVCVGVPLCGIGVGMFKRLIRSRG